MQQPRFVFKLENVEHSHSPVFLATDEADERDRWIQRIDAAIVQSRETPASSPFKPDKLSGGMGLTDEDYVRHPMEEGTEL